VKGQHHEAGVVLNFAKVFHGRNGLGFDREAAPPG
jgi:hypothetical protein